MNYELIMREFPEHVEQWFSYLARKDDAKSKAKILFLKNSLDTLISVRDYISPLSFGYVKRVIVWGLVAGDENVLNEEFTRMFGKLSVREDIFLKNGCAGLPDIERDLTRELLSKFSVLEETVINEEDYDNRLNSLLAYVGEDGVSSKDMKEILRTLILCMLSGHNYDPYGEDHKRKLANAYSVIDQLLSDTFHG